jgi:septum site-determining protein MinC
VSNLVPQHQALMFRARSYMAFMFSPKPPIVDWLADLDSTLARSKDFFINHPVALDLSGVELTPAGINHLIACLAERNIRVLGIEGFKDAEGQPGLPPILRNGRGTQNFEVVKRANGDVDSCATTTAITAPPRPAKVQPASLLIDKPVRSGQSIVFMEGDVTILGPVSSGAEIVAGGSIHVYGTLRGRAIAGACGNGRARIFCHRVEAELLAIDAYFKTSDDIDASLRSRPVQVWLESGTVKISAMN